MSQLPAYEAAYAAADDAIKKHLLMFLEGDQHKRVADAVIEAYVSEMVRQQGYVVPRQPVEEGTTGEFTGTFHRP